jgi:hypothetical protein
MSYVSAGAAATYVPPCRALPIAGPDQPPRSARLVARVSWDLSPTSTRVDRYRLSTNRSRSHWILWLGSPGAEAEVGEPVSDQPCAYCERRGVEAREAARLLLYAVWVGDPEWCGSPGGPPDRLLQEGLLAREDLRTLAAEVWPETAVNGKQ